MEEFTCKMLRFMIAAVFIHVCVAFTGTYVKTSSRSCGWGLFLPAGSVGLKLDYRLIYLKSLHSTAILATIFLSRKDGFFLL